MTASAIVLAGGRSSRFGSSKLDADLAGSSVLERTLEAVRQVAEQVIVVGRTGPAGAIRFLEDPTPFQGPLAGLSAGLDEAGSAVTVVVAGDMPLLRPAVLRLLIERVDGAGLGDTRADTWGLDDTAADAPGAEASGLEVDGVLRPLPIALRVEPARDAVRGAMAGPRRSLRDLLDGLRVATIAEAEWRRLDPDGDTVLDIDVEPDLDEARRRLATRGASGRG
jgi:molybdopterin-guanine dinucleotide biosynthesis protein A